MLNSSSGIRPDDNDPLDICYQCGIGATNFDNATDFRAINKANKNEMNPSSTLKPEDTAFVPLEDRHCTKMICR